MHLKSSNGAIDVLVCPEEEEAQCLNPTHPPISTTNGLYTSRSPYSILDAPPLPLPPCSTELVSAASSCSQMQQHQERLQHHHQQPCTLPPFPKMDQGQHGPQQALAMGQTLSPSYPHMAVTGPADDLDISLSSAAEVGGDDLGFMERLLPLDMAMFDQLSPTLPAAEDFSFSMDDSTEGINDLFDL